MKKIILTLTLCLMITAGASAVNVVSQINLGINGDFTAGFNPAGGTGELTWVGTQGTAVVVYDDNTTDVFASDLSMTFTGGKDVSASKAHAIFTSGTWTVDIWDGAILVAQFSGTTSAYNEMATDTSGQFLAGGAVALIQSATINNSYFDGFASVGSPAIGITATTSFGENDTPAFGISNYLSDWSCDNVVVTLLADETAIPEPVSIILLGAGALFLRKRG